MTLQQQTKKSRSQALVFAFIIGLGCAGLSAERASAQQPSESPRAATPRSGQLLNAAAIEERMSREGIRVTEVDLEDQVAEAEGRDQSNRKMELLIDRRTGEILSRKIDD